MPMELSPRGGVDRHAARSGGREHRVFPALRLALQQIAAQRVVQFGCRHRTVRSPSHEEIAVRVGLKKHRRRKKHVVNANDTFLEEIAVIDERRSAVKREIQGVVEIVVEVGARADEEVHRLLPSAQPCNRQVPRGQGAGDGQGDGGVVLRQDHLVRKIRQALQSRGVEGLKALLDRTSALPRGR